MPRIGITAYDLLVSCPGDVVDYVDIIRECVDNFNRTIGVANNSEIVVKHWSTDSYPESGDKPQELLNKQFVRDCDAAVALFWTKFGTPTDKYGSGTEEEIEEMLSSDKQVFMYFLDAPTNPSTLDMEQYSKIQDFRKKYASRGIYSVIKDKNEFKTQFTNHLTMHFLPLVSGEKSSFEKQQQLAPKLIIQNNDLDEIPQAKVTTFHFAECKLINEKKDSCIQKLNSLQKDYLPPRECDEVQLNDSISSINTEDNRLKYMNLFKLSEIKDADISDDIKQTISAFAIENGLTIVTDFWNVGNLKKGLSALATPFGNNIRFDGKEEEKDRYNRIEELYWDIEEYNEYKEFFASIDEKYYINLVVTNMGNTFDEDIDIKLIVNNGTAVLPEEIITPGINIIEDILKMNVIEFAYKPKSSDIIFSYPDYPKIIPNYRYDIPSPFGKSVHEEYEEQKEQFEDDINRVFCYKFYKKDDCDIISFHINYLKHNTTVAFPSVLVFSDIPKEIKYEITSKRSPDIIKGNINIINDSSD